jgi:LacI family transcriptional regulator
MSHRATIRDVAKAAGVSTTTVSRYLNKAGYVGADALTRIEDAIRKTGYAPSIMARGLKSLKSSLIVLIVPDICNPFYSKMAKTVQRLAQSHGFGLVLLDSEEREAKEAEGVLFAAQMYAAGIMVASINSCAHVAPLIREHKLAAVGLSSYDIPEAFDLVTVHKTGGTNLAALYLAGLGHRDIVFAGGRPSSGIAIGRREGFERQMRRMGLTLTEDSIFETGFSQEDGYRAGLRFLTRNPLPTAICCANDLIAFGVVSALNDSGLDVPGDVSVTGMDDVPYASLSKPRLTTVTNDGALFAEKAFEMLLKRIAGSDAPLNHYEIPNILIERESAAPPRR